MIKILADSGSDIVAEEAEELGITVIPMQIRIGGEEFLDGVTLGHRQFFEKLIESNEFPQTSQINEYRFEEQLDKLTADGSEVIVITISSKLSGTYSCAVKAAAKYGGKVHVVDSLNACVGERLLIQYAMRLVAAGEKGAAQIAAELNAQKGKIQLLALLDTLVFLRKGGRISSLTAIVGETLSVKPVISVVNGEVKLVGKAMGSKKGNNLLTQLVDKCGGIDFSMPYALAYSGLSDALLQKYIADSEWLWKGKAEELPVYMIGSTIGTHVGPGAIAVAFFAAK